MKIDYCWKRIKGSFPNLNVLYLNGVEVGFVYKPHDYTIDGKHWRMFRGIGDDAYFLGWTNTKTNAQRFLEKVFVGA